jgi:sulfide:quinone oxidoreductase
MRHTAYENVFGLGDCANTPNSKTAAAVKNQAPVVVANLLHTLEGKGQERSYDGYASCPLTTSLGKVMLAEFCYDGVVTPSFVVDPRVPRAAFWWLKKSFLPYLYWQYIVPGKGWPIVHKRHDYAEAVPSFTP